MPPVLDDDQRGATDAGMESLGHRGRRGIILRAYGNPRRHLYGWQHAAKVRPAEHAAAFRISLDVVLEKHRDALVHSVGVGRPEGVAEPARLLEAGEGLQPFLEPLVGALRPFPRGFAAVPGGGIEQPEAAHLT